ncbi:hypothetical protein [Georgenia ruanii]|nr:hypothetical protein [Georgenia ruanii]
MRRTTGVGISCGTGVASGKVRPMQQLDELRYERVDGVNVWTLVRRLG